MSRLNFKRQVKITFSLEETGEGNKHFCLHIKTQGSLDAFRGKFKDI